MTILHVKELDYCLGYIQIMKTSNSLNTSEENWKNFLVNFAIAIKKVRNMQTQGHQIAHIVKKIDQLQNGNDLFVYLLHARNSHEHTIRELTVRRDATTIIGGGSSGGTIYHGAISGDLSTNTLVTDSGISISFHPESLEVIAVVDRGRTYLPPTIHPDGSSINTRKPHELADMAFNYLISLLESHKLVI